MKNPWVIFFALYGIAVCSWFAHASYVGSPGPLARFTQRGSGGSTSAIYHK